MRAKTQEKPPTKTAHDQYILMTYHKSRKT